MLQLLDKFAWFLCFALSFSITNTMFYSILGEGSFITAIIIGMVLKAIVFPKAYILTRLDFFRIQVLKSAGIDELQSVDQKESVKKYGSLTPETREIPKSENIQKTIAATSPRAPKTPSTPGILEQFFAENIIAKIWGIILFLWVLVFLIGLYSIIGPLTKIMIGFAIWFSIYLAWVFLDKKWYTQESRITLWVWILTNYLVILSGRFLLWDDGGILDITATFLLLIINTFFAVGTAIKYKSRILLIFAFIFAYLNPLLLGESSSDPYTLLGYSMIVTFGAMYMAYIRKDEILFPMSFILAAIMCLIAPWSDANGWIAKLFCINLLWVIWLYVSTVFQKKFQYIFEILIAGIFFLIAFTGLLGNETLDSIQLAIMGISTLWFMAICYKYIHQWAYLYSVGTFWSTITLTPAIYLSWTSKENIIVSLCIILAFSVMNIGILVYKSRNFLSQNLWNITMGLISGVFFISYMIYLLGNIYFPGYLQGVSYLWVSAVYWVLSIFIFQKLGITNIKNNEKDQNIFYTITAIAISLFTLAIAFLFSQNAELVSIIWLLEANVLFFLSSRTKSSKIAFAAITIFVIGVIKFIDFIINVNTFLERSIQGDYHILMPLWIVAISLLINLISIFQKDSKDDYLPDTFYIIHNIFHVIAMFVLITSSYRVFDFESSWITLLYFSTIITILGYIYQQFRSPALHIIHLCAYSLLLFAHIILFASNLGTPNIDVLVSTTIIFIYTLPFVYEYFIHKTVQNLWLLSAYAFYLFIISTLYILHIFDITFAVTLYWWILAFIFLSYGIKNNILPMRTLWLYILSVSVGKIFFYDLWQPGVDDGVWFIVFILTGILMITLSTMYTKKYGNKLNSEFNISNLFPEDNKKPTIYKQNP